MTTLSRILQLVLAPLALHALAACNPGPPQDDGADPIPAAGGADTDGDPEPDDRTPTGADELIALRVTLPKSKVALGDPLVFSFELENTSDAPVRVNVPRIDHRSASFAVRIGTKIAKVQRNLSDMDPQTGRLIPQDNTEKQLAPGEKLRQDVTTYALLVGEQTFTPSYTYTPAGMPVRKTGTPLTIEVNPREGKQGLGVKMQTSHGDITIKLRPDLAYNTVESFVSLTRAGFFDGLTFHRIVKGFMAQGGDPQGTGGGGPGYFLDLEAHTQLLHKRGILSMARTNNPNTAGSQFFLMFTRYPSLDPARGNPGYTVFGETIDGDETLKAIEAVGVEPQFDGRKPPRETVTMEKVTVVGVE